ncbi:MAG: L-2-hydroxyglutarate oxidase [Gemmatimonadota bacterium]|nr:L-2-hydroxyglutarate oxidase [Gemmatimonadota bacterium]MDE3006663.1 L-2-hydroxyglutarate oxidase [Gemmatimonadota bacterium]MDE3015080.1 L-2-hydroxyglutarate oxidase [Gemmatimonadota bacterium]
MTDVTIIGGGIVGLATAYALTDQSTISVRILEKETALAQHQSTHNSGVLHAGLQYRPGSAKARLAREGIRRMTEFCTAHDVKHEICGKLVVASSKAELPRLDEMFDRGIANGLKGLRRLSAEAAREVEPHVHAQAAILVPEEGIADYRAVCQVLDEILGERGVELVTGAEVNALSRQSRSWRITTTAGVFESGVIVNCAGLHSDRIVTMAGEDPGCRIVPFRGEYHRLRPDREHLVRHLVYPLPEPGFPFLGVHFTRRIGGGIDAGPNAVLAFAREGYDRTTINLFDLGGALTFPGLWRFAAKYPHMVARELGQSFDRRRFVSALQRLIPEVTTDDLIPAGAGVRAQAMNAHGELLQDFVWSEGRGTVHAINAPSPAATASLAIGEEIAARVRRQLAA